MSSERVRVLVQVVTFPLKGEGADLGGAVL